VITASATASAWYAHPHLLNLAAHVLHLDFKDSVTAFQTSFFSFLSLVFAIYSGNTMAFLYDVSMLFSFLFRQTLISPLIVPGLQLHFVLPLSSIWLHGAHALTVFSFGTEAKGDGEASIPRMHVS